MSNKRRRKAGRKNAQPSKGRRAADDKVAGAPNSPSGGPTGKQIVLPSGGACRTGGLAVIFPAPAAMDIDVNTAQS
jgi:hypothetical protein